MSEPRRMIDLHCDTLSECYKLGLGIDDKRLRFSLDKLPSGFRYCQCMAVWMPEEFKGAGAETLFLNTAALFQKQMEIHRARISQVFDLSEIGSSLAEKPFAAILTIEGGSALSGRAANIKRYYDMGVRIMTLTWNFENELSGGALTDTGLKPFGKTAVREMERVGMAVDISHISDKGFWDVCEIAEKPFLATHSNARKICRHPRNLTDEMFCEITRRGGIVGLNYYRDFIREDASNGTVSDILRHIHHFLALGGENTLALGSDFDGAGLPDYLDGVDKLESFAESLEKSGIPQKVVDKILYHNANHYLKML